MRFSRIRLENWRNFTSVDVALENRAFIVGANATGKSNLLDALKFLRDLAPGTGLFKAVSLRGGVSAIRSFAARAKSNVTLEVELFDADDSQWRYRLSFNQDSDRRPIVVEEVVWRNTASGWQEILTRPDSNDQSDPERLTQTHLEQTLANQEFRAIAEVFRSVSYLHIVPQIVREPERHGQFRADPFGSDFLEQIAQTSESTKKALLKRIEGALRTVVPQLTELQSTRDDFGRAHLEARYEHWRPKAGWQNERDFSDGTLRLIGLLWALQTGSGPLLLEEPELSLHPGVVRRLVPMIWKLQRQQKKDRRRQVMITTHSTELLSDPGIQGDELLLLIPTSTLSEGTTVILGAQQEDIKIKLDDGLTAGEIVADRTDPEKLTQLVLW
ncbi:MAG: AAA family ATPase [Anaerolineae bacterium]|nr:AAA family ATPase [Anaerolineae bacterium]